MTDSNADLQSSSPGRGNETKAAPLRSARSSHGYTLDGNCSESVTTVCDLRIGMLWAACAMPYDTAGAKAISSACALTRSAKSSLTVSLEAKKSAGAMFHDWALGRRPCLPVWAKPLASGDR